MPVEGCEGESSTRGLDRLEADCKSYRQQGARFCKWRAALRIGIGTPSQKAIGINAQQLAQYAAVAQVRPAFVLLSERSPEFCFPGGTFGAHHYLAASVRNNAYHQNLPSLPLSYIVSNAIAGMRPGSCSRA